MVHLSECLFSSSTSIGVFVQSIKFKNYWSVLSQVVHLSECLISSSTFIGVSYRIFIGVSCLQWYIYWSVLSQVVQSLDSLFSSGTLLACLKWYIYWSIFAQAVQLSECLVSGSRYAFHQCSPETYKSRCYMHCFVATEVAHVVFVRCTGL